VKFQKSEASDPRDKIYALLSMATDMEELGFPQAEYEISLQEAIRKSISFLFSCEEMNWSAGFEQNYLEFFDNLTTLNNIAVIQAVAEENLEVVSRLSTHSGFDPNFLDSGGNSALLKAAEKGYHRTVHYLLRLDNINPNIQNAELQTPLSKAIENLHYPVFDILLKDKRVWTHIIDSHQRSLSTVIDKNHVAVIEMLLRANEHLLKGRPGSKGTTLSRALAIGQPETIRILLLYTTFSEIHDYFIEVLSAANSPDVCEDAFSRLMDWVTGNNYTNIDFPDKNNRTLLSWAVYGRHVGLIERLIECPGINGNKLYDNGNSLLHRAITISSTDVVKLLIKVQGVDVNKVDDLGDTPLSLAIRYGSREMVKIFLGVTGIDVNVNDQSGPLGKSLTMVELAVNRRDVEIVKLLLNSGGKLANHTMWVVKEKKKEASRRGDHDLENKYAEMTKLLESYRKQ
jgi:ankyrin repeat protein